MLRSIVDRLSVSVLLLDTSKTVILCNPPAQKLLGQSEQEIVGQSLTILLPGLQEGRVDRAIDNALTMGMSAFISPRLADTWRKAGDEDLEGDDRRQWQDKRFSQLQFHISSLRDDEKNRLAMVEIHDASAALERELHFKHVAQQQQDRTREVEAVVSNSGEAIMLFSDDGSIISCNDRARELLAFDRHKPTFMNVRDMRQALSCDPRHETPFGPADGQWREMTIYREDKTDFPAEVVLTAIHQSDHHLYILNFRDISAQKARQQELENAREAAETALAAKSRFLAVMSHEIRTPLSGVMGSIDILRHKISDQDILKHVNFMGTAAEALNAIINDVLDFSKLERHQVELSIQPFDLAKMVRESIEIHKDAAANKALILTMDIESSLPTITSGDPMRIRQILLNLVGNAVKFTASGKVSITVKTSPMATAENPLIRFAVKDTGPGIPESRLDGLFNEFVQGDATIAQLHGGTGLGLAISRSLVDIMQGHIAVSSIEGSGSVFWFDIPLPPSEPLPVALPENPAHETLQSATGGLNILVVEDSLFNQMVLRELLRQMGHQTIMVENGQLAVDHIKQASQQPDMIFMDLVMPVMGGLEAAQAIRQYEQDKAMRPNPIVALSANAFEEDKQAALEAGMNAFSTKPITLEKLTTAIQQMRPLMAEQLSAP